MLPTPDTSHLTYEDFEYVYEPSEDTFALLDALEQDVDVLKAAKPTMCLEIGSGSGCVSAFVSTMLGPSSCCCLTTDINPRASQASSRTGSQNKTTLDCVSTSLTTGLFERLRGQVDLLIFNPPYVPTEDQEVENAQSEAKIAGSWAGGAVGMDVTDCLLAQAPDLLASGGKFYLVAVPQNHPQDILSRMQAEGGLESQRVLERRAGRERLSILRFIKP